MMKHRIIEISELQDLLTRLGAKLNAYEVHALYMGALTSTCLGIGPQKLLGAILGEEPMLGESAEDANAAVGILFGYWNTLVSQREEGGVRFAPIDVPESASKDELRAFVQRRRGELHWYVRGIDAGGDDPIEFGDEGRGILEKLAQASGFFELYSKTLARQEHADDATLRQTRDLLIQTGTLCEHLIADLMEVNDRVRREAIATSVAMQGSRTDDGVMIAPATRVGRNENCPCGSGKKWKRCCGSAERAH